MLVIFNLLAGGFSSNTSFFHSALKVQILPETNSAERYSCSGVVSPKLLGITMHCYVKQKTNAESVISLVQCGFPMQQTYGILPEKHTIFRIFNSSSSNLENDRLTLTRYVEEKAVLQTCTKFDNYCWRASTCTKSLI